MPRRTTSSPAFADPRRAGALRASVDPAGPSQFPAMTMLDDRRNINRFAMVAIALLFLSFAVETLPDVGPLPFLLTIGAIFFSLLAVVVSLRVNRRARADEAEDDDAGADENEAAEGDAAEEISAEGGSGKADRPD